MVKEMVRQGGRSARIQEEVHRAVRELSATMDRAALTVPMIAEHAGVTPSTVYRRWGDLAELMADVAVQRMRPIAEPEDTGAYPSDLEAFVLQYVEEMSSKVGRAVLRDVLASADGEVHAARCCQFTYDHLQTLAARAEARGEPAPKVEDVIDLVIAPIAYHILFGDRELGTGYCLALLGRVTGPDAAL